MLLPCDAFENSQIITLEAPPRVDQFEDCLFLPANYGLPEDAHAWGVFGRDRRLLPGSGYARGPRPVLALQRDTTALDPTQVTEWAEHPCYVYGGFVQDHYGHFLTGAFARFWNWHRLAGQDLRILCHAYETVEELFAHPHIAALFESIGLTAAHFVVPTVPLRVRQIIVPHPSFEELHLVHRAFARFCHRVGKHLAPEVPSRETAPIYLTKENVTGGMIRVVNEAEVTNFLAQRGVSIVSPERLPVASQIALFAEDRLVLGFAGSAFHTSIFRPARRLLIIDYSPYLRANYALIDAANDNRAQYWHAGTGLEVAPGAGRAFVRQMQLTSPLSVAEDLLRLIDADRPVAPARKKTAFLVA